MKKLILIFTAALSVATMIVSAISVPFGVKAETSYTLRDDFGAAPLVRTMSDNMEQVELNEVHKPYTKYGMGVKLKTSSEGREYITYDLSGVKQAEISAIVKQSNFGANHGWGLSLGVTDNPENMPLNNTTNINLSNIYPIYLSTDGHPFIFTENRWWCYIAAEKYSFTPSTLDVNNQLREFTVPDEVQGVIDEDGFTIVEKGFLYPMINLEYCVEGSDEWIPMVSDSNNYRITAAEFLGGDKEYNVTVQIKNVPEGATKVRIGADYIRQTLKPSSSGDTEADVFEDFPVNYDEAIYLTGIKFTLSEVYDGGFETLEQSGIAVDASNAQNFAYGEAFAVGDVKFYDVYGNGIREENFDIGSFTVDAGEYDAYTAGIYRIKVEKGDFEVSYYVEVFRPNELVLETSSLSLSLSEGSPLNTEALVVKARTNVGNVNSPDWREYVVPADKYTVDDSSVDYGQEGSYTVTVKVGKGADTVSTTFEVTVVSQSGGSKKGCFSSISFGLAAGAAFLSVGAFACAKKRKRDR